MAQAGILRSLPCSIVQEELLLEVTGGPHVRTICSMRLTASLIVQCVRFPQLRDVLFEFLGFSGGCELQLVCLHLTFIKGGINALLFWLQRLYHVLLL